MFKNNRHDKGWPKMPVDFDPIRDPTAAQIMEYCFHNNVARNNRGDRAYFRDHFRPLMDQLHEIRMLPEPRNI